MKEKQPEHYPVPVDQEVIDNYLWYKNMLEKFEQQKIEAERNTSLRKFVRVFESRKDDNILVYTRIKKALKENDEMLLKIERNIEELREIVERNKHLEDRK
jgi:vacuolar-type H+-ATPase catalytic subunit A/Vma1